MESLFRLALGVSALAGTTSFVATAQSVISAKSGIIHYVEGRVFLNDFLVESKFSQFPDIKENQQLRTEEGRVEVLLTPGVFLRMGENSAIRMVTNRLIDTRLELLSGEVVVEADELLKDNGVTIVYKDYAVQLQKHGVYRIDSEPARLRVYDGEALVDLNGKTQEVKEGHALAMDGELHVAGFDKKKDTDELYLWGAHRSEYIAMANVSAAKMVADSGTYAGTSSWYFNPYYNMYTFLPGYGSGCGMGMGFCMNPFGYGFFSPFGVYNYLYTLPYYGGYYSPYGGGYYAPVTGGGSAGSNPGHVVHPPIRVPHGGMTPAVAARQTMAAAIHAHASGAAVGGGGSGHGSSSPSSGSFASSSSSSSASPHASSGVSMGGGHSGGGGGHK
jgi:hypothetical protein